MKYGDYPENRKLVREKAKIKKNGVYTFRGLIYRVQDNIVTHFAANGSIVESFGHFDVAIGDYNYESEAMKLLKGLK